MYKFFVTQEQISQSCITILDEDVNHIKNVLRLLPGERIEITEITNGKNYACEITLLDKNKVECNIIQELESIKEANTYLHIFQGLPKADKLEWIIQKAVEIGVSEITPVSMEHSIVKLDAKTENKKVERWRKIAEVAAKQSKREKLTTVNLPIPFSKIYDNLREYDIVIVAYENETQQDIKTVLQELPKKKNRKIAIIIGPEGGITEQEVKDLANKGAISVSLGKRILRTETAPLVLASVIMYEFDEMK